MSDDMTYVAEAVFRTSDGSSFTMRFPEQDCMEWDVEAARARAADFLSFSGRNPDGLETVQFRYIL